MSASGGFPIDLVLFGMIAAFLVLRLRSILGKRQGFERQAPPVQPVRPATGPIIDAKAEPVQPAAATTVPADASPTARRRLPPCAGWTAISIRRGSWRARIRRSG